MHYDREVAVGLSIAILAANLMLLE